MTPSATPARGTTDMEAVVITRPRMVEIQRVGVPALVSGTCLVEIAYLGLCGTDAALYRGDSSYLAAGLISLPLRLGHEWSGTVAAIGDDVHGLRAGDRVAGHNFRVCWSCAECRSGRPWLCRHRSEAGVRGATPGMASELALVPAAAMVRLPDEVDLLTGACLEPVTCAMRGLNAVSVREDDRVAVIGTGMLGLAAAQLARAIGATVEAIGIDDAGLRLAAELGAVAVHRPESAPTDAFSVVVEASGAPPAVALAPRLAAPGGRVALVGVAHDAVPSFPAADIVLKDLVVRGTIGGLDQWDRVVALARRGTLDLRALVEAVVPYRDARGALERLVDGPRRRPKLLLAFAGDIPIDQET